MTIRPYQPADAPLLVTIFEKNVPQAFGPNEISEYADFLQTNTDPYFVAEHDGQLVGACGHYIKTDWQTARIVWILTDPDVKGQAVGTVLLTHNLNLIRQQTTVGQVECQTSQVAFRFFEKFGFQLQYTEPDHWSPGLDLYFMTLVYAR